MSEAIDVLFLIARPAAGKSEVIDFFKKKRMTGPQALAGEFHLRNFTEIDDFPMLWTWFEEDKLLEEMGYPRIHTDKEGYFKWPYLWNLLIERMDLEYKKLIRNNPRFHDENSVIIEFSRGSEHGGYISAFPHFSEEMLKKAGILYIDVSWEESLRKNRARFNPDRPDSILEHAVPDDKLERMYKYIDWEEFTAGDDSYVTVKGIRVPYAVMPNEDDVTTPRGPELAARLKTAMDTLYHRYAELHR